MAKAVKQPASGTEKPDTEKIVLTIDIGGSHVKILTSAGGEERRADSGPGLTPQQMIDAVKKLAEGLSY
ncbi:MAG: ROK family protein, partial [Mesorhizobium sp.]